MNKEQKEHYEFMVALTGGDISKINWEEVEKMEREREKIKERARNITAKDLIKCGGNPDFLNSKEGVDLTKALKRAYPPAIELLLMGSPLYKIKPLNRKKLSKNVQRLLTKYSKLYYK